MERCRSLPSAIGFEAVRTIGKGAGHEALGTAVIAGVALREARPGSGHIPFHLARRVQLFYRLVRVDRRRYGAGRKILQPAVL